MRSLLLAAIIAASVAGCASDMVWTKANLDMDQWRRDAYECYRDGAYLPARNAPGVPLGPAMDAVHREQMVGFCMESRGYHQERQK